MEMDSRIFNESNLKERFESGHFKGRLLGDSGYKLEKYLFTPLLVPTNPKEEIYNKAHKTTRNTIERCFGVLKQRFRCLLDGITVSFYNAKILIVALAVLHNIAIEENDDPPTDDVNLEPSNTFDMQNNRDSNSENENERVKYILKQFIENNF